MIAIKVNGKKHSIPEAWEEVTFKMFVDMIGAKDDNILILSILIGVPIDQLKGAKIQGLDLIIPKLKFLRKEPAIVEQPVSLGAYIFPKDVTLETIEQFQEVLSEIQRLTTEAADLKVQTEALAFYAAIYCQAIKEPFDHEKAQYLAKTFMDYPCLEVMSAGSFFQAKCLAMQSGLSMSYLRKDILLKKNRPGLSRLMKRLGFMLHLTPSRDM